MNLWNPYILGGLLSLYLISGFTAPVMAEQLPQDSPPNKALQANRQLPPATQTSTGLMNKIFIDGRQSPSTGLSAGTQYQYMANTKATEKDLYETPLPDYLSPVNVPLNKKEKKAVKLSKKWINNNVPPFLSNGGKLMYVFGSTLPTIICSPLMGSDLELQEGEIVKDVLLGDTARWRWQTTSSGELGREKVHIIFKPTDTGLVTTAVIPTNRRVYHIKLVSNRKNYTPYIGFEYPEDQRRLLQQQFAEQARKKTWETAPTTAGTVLDLSALDFGYIVTGKAHWKPLQVYNDGTRTVIRLPQEASQSDLPVLLVEKAGQEALVNYRVRTKGRHTSLIVDEIFEEAMLIAGVGTNQQKIKILKQEEK
ncbi:P-type conjugative transfer protein TrbG [Halodesulfovibrio marinisediminis]|uniref:Type IV secretion system protein VirB9 n=1 Tax=Halodesulfovibrio marinisediminis DSM 17456 TaxID=1121457 RepID=A0A1N6FET6_9BACT|nr:P-type conjugative transfer protein TrbG [Halodesulfovibrio marinisediminis]SIN93798.1 type IV secretion system protein VirB9 [Halodesulfovibrio marinisediminis DSM 17456]